MIYCSVLALNWIAVTAEVVEVSPKQLKELQDNGRNVVLMVHVRLNFVPNDVRTAFWTAGTYLEQWNSMGAHLSCADHPEFPDCTMLRNPLRSYMIGFYYQNELVKEYRGTTADVRQIRNFGITVQERLGILSLSGNSFCLNPQPQPTQEQLDKSDPSQRGQSEGPRQSVDNEQPVIV